MLKKVFCLGVIALGFASCSNQTLGTDDYVDVLQVSVDRISPEMAKVRDYVPKNAVIAHRGSTYWVPEETESAFRWAREMGADYLEADLQVSMDGVILALHDEDLSRTTNIESVYGETVPESRPQYYMSLGYTQEEAMEMYMSDKALMATIPMKYMPAMYTYEELLALDAGTWFNDDNPEQARTGFSTQRQYISSLEDLIMISKGMRLKRDANGNRIYIRGGKTGGTVSSLLNMIQADEVAYTFEYESDPAWTGHVPGIYLEFKQPMYGPSDIEQRVYDLLAKVEDMNIIEKPEADDAPFYIDGKVNVGNTNGKVVLQTFVPECMARVKDVFDGQVPMCYLVGPTANIGTPIGYAESINLAIAEKAHIMGPYIGSSSYPSLIESWCDYLVDQAGLISHPWSFDTTAQMQVALGKPHLVESTSILYTPPYFDAMFTNRTDLTLDFMIMNNLRSDSASKLTPNPNTVLDNLGYIK